MMILMEMKIAERNNYCLNYGLMKVYYNWVLTPCYCFPIFLQVLEKNNFVLPVPSFYKLVVFPCLMKMVFRVLDLYILVLVYYCYYCSFAKNVLPMILLILLACCRHHGYGPNYNHFFDALKMGIVCGYLLLLHYGQYSTHFLLCCWYHSIFSGSAGLNHYLLPGF